MSELFLQILNMGIAAGWVVLGVVVLRLCFRRAPKWITVLLWGLVAVRLLLPFSIESALSLLPSGETVPHEILQAEKPAIQSGIPSVNAVVNPFLQDSFAPAPGNSVNPMQVVTEIAAWVWIVGVAGMMLYFFVSFFLLKRKLREAVLVKENVWACDGVDTPFLFGVFRPRIYLPSFLAEEDAAFVIAHEKAHLKRKDHLWKPLGFLLLAVYWFHPLLWVGYILLCKDIELACDEKVLRELGEESKKPYSNALINCSASRKWISACPLAFGENGVKARVKSALHYKKPTLWILIGAILVTSFAAVWFLTDPLKEGEVIPSEGASSEPVSAETPSSDNETSLRDPNENEEYVEETPLDESIANWFGWQDLAYVKDIALEEYPGKTFYIGGSLEKRWEIRMRDEEEDHLLFRADQIAGAYFMDLNGDGMRELLIWYTYGSSNVSAHVGVYDIVAMEKYEAGVRDEYSCWLTAQNGFLYLEVTPCDRETPLSILGTPVLTEKNGEVVIDMVDPLAIGEDGTSFPVGRTLIKTTKDAYDTMYPSIRLQEDGTFTMTYSVISSYVGGGTYTLEKGQLVLNTADGKFTYRFDVAGDKLVYREEGSTGSDWGADLFDGCIFE